MLLGRKMEPLCTSLPRLKRSSTSLGPAATISGPLAAFIWSIGCIYLEFVIWLLYGSAELARFRADLGEELRFYTKKRGQQVTSSMPQLHSRVQRWVDWIRDDERCPKDTAIRHLVELVVTRLLVPEVGRAEDSSPGESMLHESRDVSPSARSPGAPSVTPMIKRSSTSSIYFNIPDDSLYGNRAHAQEMDQKMRQIYKDATSRANSTKKSDYQLPWFDTDAPEVPRKGPTGQYGQTLGPADTSLQVRPGNRTQEVR